MPIVDRGPAGCSGAHGPEALVAAGSSGTHSPEALIAAGSSGAHSPEAFLAAGSSGTDVSVAFHQVLERAQLPQPDRPAHVQLLRRVADLRPHPELSPVGEPR